MEAVGRGAGRATRREAATLVEEVEGLRGPDEVGTGGFLGMVLVVEEGTDERVEEMEEV